MEGPDLGVTEIILSGRPWGGTRIAMNLRIEVLAKPHRGKLELSASSATRTPTQRRRAMSRRPSKWPRDN